MTANERYSSPIRNSNGSPMTTVDFTQEIRLISRDGDFWICEGWYSNAPDDKAQRRIPISIIQSQFTKVV